MTLYGIYVTAYFSMCDDLYVFGYPVSIKLECRMYMAQQNNANVSCGHCQ